jgi:hypothetical protein
MATPDWLTVLTTNDAAKKAPAPARADTAS